MLLLCCSSNSQSPLIVVMACSCQESFPWSSVHPSDVHVLHSQLYPPLFHSPTSHGQTISGLISVGRHSRDPLSLPGQHGITFYPLSVQYTYSLKQKGQEWLVVMLIKAAKVTCTFRKWSNVTLKCSHLSHSSYLVNLLFQIVK